MGFLTTGSTFTWEEAVDSPVEYVRKHGILQFLAIYEKNAGRTNDLFLFGDEIEYTVLHVDDTNNQTRLALRGHEIIDQLTVMEQQKPAEEMLWRPEYGRHMIEGTPGAPFGFTGVGDIAHMEASMKQRRKAIRAVLRPNERIATIVNYPLMGAYDPTKHISFAEPDTHRPGVGPVAHSLFTPDDIIHPHFRFSTLTANIRERRGSRVEINVPLYRDTNTQSTPLPIPHVFPVSPPASPSSSPSLSSDSSASVSSSAPSSSAPSSCSWGVTSDPFAVTPAQKPYNIYMDSMAFGMGMSCLQTTFQARDLTEARYIYDQMAIVSPILLAISAGCPIFRGYLADVDARWNIISGSVDDRTEEERGLKPLSRSKYVINKSR